MNRLAKKCFVVSAGLHLLLVIIFLAGSAFLAPQQKVDNSPILDFIPVKTIDAEMTGGGSPTGRHPSPPPPAEKTEPKPPAPKTEPVPEAAPPEKIESLEPAKEQKKKLVINTTPVVRKSSSPPKANTQPSEEDRRSREMADARRRAAAQLSRAADNIASDLSGGTSVELKGPGGGGVPYASFSSAVKSVYARAWILPDGASDDDGTAVASVTIARDGSVISARIIRSSGRPEIDRSVEAALNRVKYVAPLPDGVKENQRTVTINFSAKAQRLLG